MKKTKKINADVFALITEMLRTYWFNKPGLLEGRGPIRSVHLVCSFPLQNKISAEMAQLSPSCLDNQRPLGPVQTLTRTAQCSDHNLKTAGSHLLNPCLPFHKPVLGKCLHWANRPRFLHLSPSVTIW